jgi:hypothetical protein
MKRQFKSEGERLFWQAHLKTKLVARRNIRLMQQGKADFIPCSGDYFDAEIIRIIDDLLVKVKAA